jgi:predicted GH43/DUF377 family glycosyl hydrolase
MDWRKLGRVYVPDGEQDWAVSHAFCPTSIQLDEDRIRVYVAFLDRERVGRIGFVDVEAANPLNVLNVSADPVLDIGAPGEFDDNGVTPLSLCTDGDSLRLYYAGWQLGVRVRYFLFLGLAVSSDGGMTFERHSRVPVLERSDAEPLMRTGAHVHDTGGRWRMWYAGGDEWVEDHGKIVPSYPLRYLESGDGLSWGPSGSICLAPNRDQEIGFARPFVVEDGGRLRMWYSIRPVGTDYRLGYAESDDGLEWERRDDLVGIDVSDHGWDSEMIGLACLQQTKYGTYLFYNGNNFGETGFGAAVADEL